MSGFLRQQQPPSFNRAGVTAVITRLVAEEIAQMERNADPFGIADPCPHNAGGPHRFIGSCGDVVCVHCSKVASS